MQTSLSTDAPPLWNVLSMAKEVRKNVSHAVLQDCTWGAIIGPCILAMVKLVNSSETKNSG